MANLVNNGLFIFISNVFYMNEHFIEFPQKNPKNALIQTWWLQRTVVMRVKMLSVQSFSVVERVKN